jgi:hypothetical protein
MVKFERIATTKIIEIDIRETMELRSQNLGGRGWGRKNPLRKYGVEIYRIEI